MRAPATSAAALLLILGSSAAQAYPPSAITNAFVATVRPAAEAMSFADSLAQTQAGTGRLRAFARRDSTGQLATLDGVDAWARGISRDAAAEAASPTIDHLGPTLYLFNGAAQANVPGSNLTGAEQEALAGLKPLRGVAFDDAYVATQVRTLARLLDVYTDYIKNGDDTTLRTLAVHQRPRVLDALAELRRR